MRNFSTLSAAIALAILSACGTARDVNGTVANAASCTSCHGGVDNSTGAPPTDADGLTSSAAVGAHTAHLSLGVTCATCHAYVNPSSIDFPGHRNGVADVVFSGVAFDPTTATTPTYDLATHTCSNVYCHAPSTVGGGAGPKAPRWNQGPLPEGCGSCHTGPGFIHGGRLTVTQCTVCHPGSVDASGHLIPSGTHADGRVEAFAHPSDWVTPTTTTAHGFAATYQDPAYPTGLQGCRSCHGADLLLPVTDNVPACSKCHGSAWQSNCTFCHGDSSRLPASLSPAPPRDVAGRTASARVGAHQTHLVGKVVSNGVACSDCHGGATRALPTGVDHVNGTTEVTPKQPGQNAATGSFDAATGTCSNTYCHGNLPRNPRSPASTPSWTATSGESACDSCHAPNGAYGASDAFTGRHQTHRCGTCHTGVGTFATQVGCYACHPGYKAQFTDLASNVTPPAVNLETHVDGAVEVVGTTAPLYAGFALTLTYTAPSGGNGPSCTTNCHAISGHASAGAPAGAASW